MGVVSWKCRRLVRANGRIGSIAPTTEAYEHGKQNIDLKVLMEITPFRNSTLPLAKEKIATTIDYDKALKIILIL